ncbi:MAG: glutamate 5-kinase [Candidatus Omnitrophica bacterium]|nr:glutamate 5-kinase [Candidatus Omnitrophota bacterium]
MSGSLNPVENARKAKRIVVKVGTSVLAREGKVSRHRVEEVASDVGALWDRGKEVILVTSGAIGVGMGVLGLKARPAELEKLQAAAAIGQGVLMQWYTTRFEHLGRHAAQVLLTRGDLEEERRRRNIKATLSTLLSSGIVPIVNENDTVSVEEIRYGDNDVLSADVAALMEANLLLILSVKQGGSRELSTGGMKSKEEAAKIVKKRGIQVVLADSGGPIVLKELILGKGELERTLFL